jgi:hypothetical protein
MNTFDQTWSEPIFVDPCGHEILPLPTLDVIEGEICGAEDPHGTPWLALATWDEI